MVPKAASASKKRKKKRQKGTKQWIGQLVWRKGGKLFLAFWHFHEPDLWYSAFNAFMRVISLFLIAKIREGILFYVHQCNVMKKLHKTMDQASARGFYLSHTDLQLSQMNRYYRAKSNTLLSSFHENNTHL